MVEITDDYMTARLATVRAYPAVRLLKGPNYKPQQDRTPEEAGLIREHGRRNMRLQAEGVMALVGPIANGADLVGLCVFTIPDAEVRTVMDGDIAVIAGFFVYDVITWYGFPGDSLPPA
jgi:hypothetical protein